VQKQELEDRKKMMVLSHHLNKIIYGILSSQIMTAQELVGCLMSEPYSLMPADLEAVTSSLKFLMSEDRIWAEVRTNKQDLSIDVFFRRGKTWRI